MLKKTVLSCILFFFLLPSLFALTLTKSIPSEAQINFPLNSKIVLIFSENMSLGSGECTLNGTAVTPTFTAQYVMFSPSMSYLTDYTLIVPSGALKGSSGALYGGLTLHFRSVAEPMPWGCNVGVSKDGSYQYSTIQAAIDAAPSNSETRHVIFVKAGEYDETIQIPVSKKNLTIWGQEQSKVIVRSDAASKSVASIAADGCYLFNLSILNSSTSDSSSALSVSGDKTMVRYCSLKGTQHVLRTESVRSYLYECTVLGKNDLVRTDGITNLDHCHLKQTVAGAFILASTPSFSPFGAVLSRTRLISSASNSTVGKAMNESAAIYLEECEMPSVLSITGWNKAGFTSPRFAEYMNYGPGARRYEVAYLSSSLASSFKTASIFKTSCSPTPITDHWNPFDVLASTGKDAATWIEGNGYGANRGGNGGPIYTVNNETDLATYLTTDERCTIRLQGSLTLSNALSVGSNKTLTGVDESSTIIGNLRFNDGKKDIIVRNLNVTHPGTLKENDGFAMEGAHRILVEHVSFYDCSDGECDMRNGTDSVTQNFNKMYYVNQTDGHRFTMICDGVMMRDADGVVIDYGEPLHITMHNNWWSTLCDQRMPSSTNAHAHMYNCYWFAPGNFYCSLARTSSEFYSENNYYRSVRDALGKGTYVSKIYSNNNIFNGCTGEQAVSKDVMDAPDYVYTPSATADVPAINSARAGNYWFDASYLPNALHTTEKSSSNPTIISLPTGYEIRIQQAAKAKVRIFDLHGRCLFNQDFTDESELHVRTNLNKGVYIIQIKTTDSQWSKVMTRE